MSEALHAAEEAPRPLGPALGRGLRGCCPACGRGRLFQGFLRVAPACEVCQTPFHHHRADDLPAYLVIFIVGHVLITPFLLVENAYEPPLWLSMTLWPFLFGLVSLALLRPVKGAVVALQWSRRMHGFGGSED